LQLFITFHYAQQQPAKGIVMRGGLVTFSRLVLVRKAGQYLVVGDTIIRVSDVTPGGRVKLCIEAPRNELILRGELVDENKPPRDAA